MLKSKGTTDTLTQTDSSQTIWNSLHKHNRTEMKTAESFDKHTILLLLPFLHKNRLNLTEENKKQEPCRQHSTMSLIKYRSQYPKIWIILKRNQILPKNDTQKSGNSPKRHPKSGSLLVLIVYTKSLRTSK